MRPRGHRRLRRLETLADGYLSVSPIPRRRALLPAPPDTKPGGHRTQQVTQGYGPEMFSSPRAVAGEGHAQGRPSGKDVHDVATLVVSARCVLAAHGS